MQGQCVPFVGIPRYSTLVGAEEFTTAPMDVSQYANGHIVVWRGTIVGTSGAVDFFIEDSEDGQGWDEMTSYPSGGFDPGPDATMRIPLGFVKKWFRIRVELAGASPAMTCWAVGELVKRVT